MKKLEIEIQNIGGLRGNHKFRLSSGLNLIYSPNASGKTSLVNAIKSLMAEMSEKELENLINDYERAAKIKIELNGKKGSLEIGKKKEGVKISQTPIFRERLPKILCFVDLENEIVNAIFEGNEKKLKELLKEITGVEILERVKEILNGMISSYEEASKIKKEEYEIRKGEIEGERREIERRLREVRREILEIERDPLLKPYEERINEIRREMESLIKEIEKLRVEIEGRERSLSIKKAELEKLKTDKEALEKSYAKYQKELEKLRKEQVSYRKKIELLEKKRKEILEKRNKASELLKEKEIILEKRKEVAECVVCPYCGSNINRKKIQSEIERLRKEMNKLKKEILAYESENMKITMQINELKEKFERRMKAVEETMKKITKELTDIEKQIRRTEEDIKRIGAGIESFHERKLEIEKQIEKLNVEYERVIPYKDIIERLRRLKEEEKYLTERERNLEKKIKELTPLLEEIKLLNKFKERAALLEKYFELRTKELREDVVNEINRELKKNFHLLKLAEFDHIGIRKEDFGISLVRKGKIPTTLSELSDAEKTLLSIILTLILKNYLLPDFPVYAIDSLLELVDEGRLKKVLEYLIQCSKKQDIIILATKVKPFKGKPELLSQRDIFLNKIPF